MEYQNYYPLMLFHCGIRFYLVGSDLIRKLEKNQFKMVERCVHREGDKPLHKAGYRSSMGFVRCKYKPGKVGTRNGLRKMKFVSYICAIDTWRKN